MDLNLVDNTPLPHVPEDCSAEQWDDIFADTLATIMEETNHIRHKAEDLAIALRIRNVLPERPKLRDVMQAWLNREYNVTTQGLPSWRLLVSKIASDTGGANKALAQRIASRHPVGSAVVPKRTPSVPNAMSPHQETHGQFSRNMSTSSTSSWTSTGSSSSTNISNLSSGVMQMSIPEKEENDTTSTVATPTFSTGPSSSCYSRGQEENREDEEEEGPSNVSSGHQVSEAASIHSTLSSGGGRGGGGLPYVLHPPYRPAGTQAPPTPPIDRQYSRPEEVVGTDPGHERASETDGKGLFRPFKHKEPVPQPHPQTPPPTQATPTKPSQAIEPYKMSKHDGYHGHALIINNINITGRDKREGAEHDSENLRKTFNVLGYRCHSFIDQTAGQMLAHITEMVKLDHTHYDSFVCCLLSHGDTGKVFGVDDKAVYLEDIKEDIIQIPSLVGKPKIFIVQACRGRHLPSARSTQFDDDSTTNRIQLPHESDLFYGYATTPNTKACRFTDIGSWYIIELTNALQRHYKELDLMSMVQIAHYEVATNPEYVYERNEKGPNGKTVKKTYRQSPQMVSTLIRPVRF